MKEIIVLITMKLKYSLKFKDIQICIQEGVEKTITLIQKWADNSDISAVISFDGNIIREKFGEEINYQIYLVRVIRIQVRKVQMYFKV